MIYHIPRRAYLRRYTRPRPRRRSRPAGRDSRYRAWIRRQPCLVCQFHGDTQCSRTEGHHHGPRAFARKAPDRRMLPLCTVHHRTGSASAHVLGRRFAEYHGIDLEAAIRRLNALYDSRYAEAA